MPGIALAVIAIAFLVIFLIPQKSICRKCGKEKARIVQKRTSEKGSVRIDYTYLYCTSCGEKECVGFERV
jgi:hypothetical protein